MSEREAIVPVKPYSTMAVWYTNLPAVGSWLCGGTDRKNEREAKSFLFSWYYVGKFQVVIDENPMKLSRRTLQARHRHGITYVLPAIQ